MLSADIGGKAELKHVQALLLKSGSELEARLLKETRAAMRPTQKEVKAAAAAMLPHRAGYAAVMSRAVRVLTRVSAARSSVRAKVRVTARGRAQKRDVARVNAGVLRHPLFGRRLHWYTTGVKPGFVSLPIKALADRVGDGAKRAANDVADEIVRG